MTFDKLQQRWAERARQAAQRAEALEERVRSQGTKLFRQFGVRKVVLFGSRDLCTTRVSSLSIFDRNDAILFPKKQINHMNYIDN